ncbi:MAG TPA: hypothetical protein VGK73_17555 [Polyangiaceae bacterium]
MTLGLGSIPLGGGIANTDWTPAVELNVLAWYYALAATCWNSGNPASDGETVDEWHDLSAQNSDVEHGALSDPTLRTSGWASGVPAVEFTAANQGLSSSTTAVALHLSGTNTPFSAMFAVQVDAFAATQGLFAVFDSASDACVLFEILTSKKLRFTLIDGSGAAALQTGVMSLVVGHNRIGFAHTGTHLTTWVNGAKDIDNVACAVAGLHTFDGTAIGTSDIAAANTLDGMIQEALFVNFACNDGYYQRWRAYSIQNHGY